MDKADTVAKTDVDAEIMAVRDLIAQSVQVEADKPENTDPAVRKAHSFPAIEPMAKMCGDSKPKPKPGFLGEASKKTANALWSRIKSYRPERKSILLTSMVLLLILQPAFVLGWVFAGIAVVAGCYFVMGSDLFWRRTLMLYRKLEQLRPNWARRLKVWAYYFSRKWEKQIAKLPKRFGSKFQLPDLRGLMAADEKHDAALNERLSRLH